MVLNHNGATQNWETMARCLDCAVGSDYANKEVIFVDNGSTDDSVNLVRARYGGKIKYVCLPRNRGYSGGMNAGAKSVSPNTKYVFFTNNDLVFPPEAVRGMVEFMEANPDVAVATCVEYGRNGRFNQAGIYLDVRLVHHKPTELSRPIYVTAAENFLVVRKEAFDKLGGFDDNFFQVYDDQDLCLRAWLSGYRVACNTKFKTLHLHTLPDKKTPQRLYILIRNRYLVMLKLYGLRTLIPYFPLRVANDVYWSMRDPGWRRRRGIVALARALVFLLVHPDAYLGPRRSFQKIKRVAESQLVKKGLLRP